MSKPCVCHFCGAVLSEADAHEFDERIMCEHCLEEYTTLCDCCLDRLWRAEAEGNHIYTLCRDCYENNYVFCTSCGTLLHIDDANYHDDSNEPYCQTCYDKICNESIRSYYYKPSPIFYGEGSLFMGVELEIDHAGESNANAQQILELANTTEEHVYCKHDGSLDEGFEIVSHPMTLDYHAHSMNWEEILAKAISMGYVSHNAGSCGLHIHCNRNFFGDDSDEQGIAIGRTVCFVEKNWNELVRFTRRTVGSLNRWAAKYATISDTVHETYAKAKSKDSGRYVAVNLQNYHTIEFRMFRGTLRYETFMATLQLVDEICRLSVRMDDYDLESCRGANSFSRSMQNPNPS